MGRSESDVELDGEPVDEFVPSYSSWRHGGWYVDNVRYPSGAIGCVSRNYEDRKWRIVCDPRPFEDAPTFKSRDDAARAELELTERHAAAPCTCPPPPADVDERLHHLHRSNDCARHGWSGRAWRAVEEFEARESARTRATALADDARALVEKLIRFHGLLGFDQQVKLRSFHSTKDVVEWMRTNRVSIDTRTSLEPARNLESDGWVINSSSACAYTSVPGTDPVQTIIVDIDGAQSSSEFS